MLLVVFDQKMQTPRDPAPARCKAAPASSFSQRLFPFVMGFWLAVVFSKFGNPIIFSELIDGPRDMMELGLNAWPTAWGYGLLGILFASALPLARRKSHAPKWVLALPLVWFGWQCISGCQTVICKLTEETLLSFVACVG